MLQYSKTLCSAAARLTYRRVTASLTVNSQNNSVPKEKEDITSEKLNTLDKNISIDNSSLEAMKQRIKGSLVRSTIKDKVESAKSINDLVELVNSPDMDSKDIITIMATISKWVHNSTASVNAKETVKISKKNSIKTEQRVKLPHLSKSRSKDTSVTNITPFMHLSTPAMILVISKLALQKNRHLPLLKSLAENITKYNKELSLKQCSSLLYAMAVLTFFDKDLIEKISCDLLIHINDSSHPPIIDSIITSMGFLRYRNEEVLEKLCTWILSHSTSLRLDNFAAFLTTCATVGYKSENIMRFIKAHISPIQQSDVSKVEDWIDIVWSLTILNAAEHKHFSCILDKNITDSEELSISKKLKLLNISAAAKYIYKDYNGPLIRRDSSISELSLTRSRKKQPFVDALSDTLQTILPSSSYFSTDVDTQMGFFIDAECAFETNGKPVALSHQNEKTKRVAIMLHDYHDYCQGSSSLVGIIQLYIQLLEGKGYYVLNIPCDHFSPEDRLEKRSGYMKERLQTVKQKLKECCA